MPLLLIATTYDAAVAPVHSARLAAHTAADSLPFDLAHALVEPADAAYTVVRTERTGWLTNSTYHGGKKRFLRTPLQVEARVAGRTLLLGGTRRRRGSRGGSSSTR